MAQCLTQRKVDQQCLIMHDVTITRWVGGRDWLQQLCIVNIDACRKTQETFISFYFISFIRCADGFSDFSRRFWYSSRSLDITFRLFQMTSGANKMDRLDDHGHVSNISSDQYNDSVHPLYYFNDECLAATGNASSACINGTSSRNRTLPLADYYYQYEWRLDYQLNY